MGSSTSLPAALFAALLFSCGAKVTMGVPRELVAEATVADVKSELGEVAGLRRIVWTTVWSSSGRKRGKGITDSGEGFLILLQPEGERTRVSLVSDSGRGLDRALSAIRADLEAAGIAAGS